MSPPSPIPRVVIDTDAANEIDDQFAIAWALCSPEALRLEAVHAAPFSHGRFFRALATASSLRGHATSDFDRLASKMSAADLERFVLRTPPANGMTRSYDEILRLFEAAGVEPAGRVKRGAGEFMRRSDEPVASEAVEHLISLARSASPEHPIYVATIGAPTNVASALVAEPSIGANLRVLFLAGFPSTAGLDDDSFNLVQDRIASNVLFESGVPLVYIPGYQVAELLQLSLPSAREWLATGGRLSQFLFDAYQNNPINPHFDEPGRSWVLWDMVAVAWLLNRAWVPTREVPRARVTEAHRWETLPTSSGSMQEAYHVKRNEVFRDFLDKLATFEGKASQRAVSPEEVSGS